MICIWLKDANVIYTERYTVAQAEAARASGTALLIEGGPYCGNGPKPADRTIDPTEIDNIEEAPL